MHHILFPFSIVGSSIFLFVHSSSFYLPFEPVTFVTGSIFPVIYTFPVFVPIFELSFISIVLSCHLNAEPRRFIAMPTTHICISIAFDVFSLALSPGLDPLTVVIISRRVCKLSLAVGLVIFPLANVYSFIGPSLSAKSISLIIFYISLIDDAGRKS